MKRRRARAVMGGRALLVLVAAATLVHGGAASAQSRAALGGYQGVAQGDGVHVFYNPAGVIPISPPVDAGVPDAYVTIASGPSTFARASAADPGDLLANPDALLSQGAPPPYKPGTVPAYPYRATASSGTRPNEESSPAPGVDARASADGKSSAATATMPGSTAPAVATFGTVTSTATTETDGATVTLHSRSEISDLNVLGVVAIGSIVTDITATSDGTTVTLSGGTVVSDAFVLGTPVVIDANGVQPAPGSTTTTHPLGAVTEPAVGNLKDALGRAGLHITLSGPVKLGNNKAGQLTSDGLRIDFELSDRTFPALKTLLDAVPELPSLPGAPGVADVITVAEARHLVALEIGRGMVSLTARPARPATIVPAARSSVSAPSTGSRPALGSPSPQQAAAPSIATAAPLAPASQRGAAIPVGAGVGALALVVLLAQPFVGDWLGRGSAAVLSSDQFTACPWEER